jgi:hypothetical protein
VEQCCTFRGSFSKLDVRSGFILWQTFMLPNNYGKIGEYARAAIWGSSQERIQEFSLGWVIFGLFFFFFLLFGGFVV